MASLADFSPTPPMSLEQNRDALRGLDGLARNFLDLLRNRAEGARYQRSNARSAALVEQVRRARHHLSLAIDALEGQSGEEQLATSRASEDRQSSWLRDRVSGVVGVLTGKQSASTEEASPSQDCGVLAGDSNALGVPDLIEALHAQGQSGILRLSYPEDTIELHFCSGGLIHAFSHKSPRGLRLGDLLVSASALTGSELRSALAQHLETQRPLGEVLTRGGWVTEDDLEDALDHQIRAVFRRIWSQPQATYTFEPGLPDTPGDRAEWNVTQLLLEGARAEDEASQSEGSSTSV